jgi:hypothetical protein
VSHPSDQIVQAGRTTQFAIAAEGSGMQYQWKKDGTVLTGKTSAVLTLTNASLSAEGLYSCVVTAPGFVDAESGSAGLSVIDKPIVSGNVACTASVAKLSVQPQLKPVQVCYQWFRDTQPLVGATYSWIQLKQTSGDMSAYYCMVTNSHGVYSDTVSLIQSQPVISVQPVASTDADAEETVVLTTTAMGQGLSYQWFFEGTELTGEKNTSLTFIAQKELEGKYVCKVSNACGDAESNEAIVKVNLATSLAATQVLSHVRVYPNPAEVQVTIIAPEGSTIEIVDITGRKVFHAIQSMDKMSVPMNAIQSGIYMVTIQYMGGIKTLKLVKN